MPRNIFDSDNVLFNELFQNEAAASEQSQLFHLIELDTPDGPFRIVDHNYDVTFGLDDSSNPVVYTKFPCQFSEVSVSNDGTITKASVTVANVSREIMQYVVKYRGLSGKRVTVKTVYSKFAKYHDDGSVNSGYDPTAYLEEEYLIDSYTANEQVVVFNLEAIIDLEIKLPRRRFNSNSCSFTYKDASTCGYTNSGTVNVTNNSNRISSTLTGSIAVGDKIRLTLSSHVEDKVVTAVASDNTYYDLNSSWSGSTGTATISLLVCNKSLTACKAHGNTQRFGGFPGVPTTTRRLVL